MTVLKYHVQKLMHVAIASAAAAAAAPDAANATKAMASAIVLYMR